jgi:hypothetical protein
MSLKRARKKRNRKFGAAIDSYLKTALWSSNDNADDAGGDPLDQNFSARDISSKTRGKMAADLARFARQNKADLEGMSDSDVGYYFWLSRNGHGVSFSDWGYEHHAPEKAERLDRAARKFGQYDLYVGDDGKIHGAGG